MSRDDTPIQATASTTPLSGTYNTSTSDHDQLMNIDCCLVSTRGTGKRRNQSIRAQDGNGLRRNIRRYMPISDIYVYLIVTSLKRRVNSCQEVLYVPDRGAVDAVA